MIAKREAPLPVVRVGQHGLRDSVMAEVELALDSHELVKIKLAVDDRELRTALIDELCEKSSAEKVQVIGKTVSVYRQNAKKPVIELPRK